MKSFLLLISFILFQTTLSAHSLILNLLDNEDGTITIAGSFNTGETAQGALVKLEAVSSGKILFQERLSDEGELTITIPKVPYQIVLDGGPGHQVTKEGIPPQNGFIKEKTAQTKKKKKTKSRFDMSLSDSTAVNYSIICAFILLIATIFIGIRNTNKIIQQIKRSG